MSYYIGATGEYIFDDLIDSSTSNVVISNNINFDATPLTDAIQQTITDALGTAVGELIQPITDVPSATGVGVISLTALGLLSYYKLNRTAVQDVDSMVYSADYSSILTPGMFDDRVRIRYDTNWFSNAFYYVGGVKKGELLTYRPEQGSNILNLDATNIKLGTINNARLPTNYGTTLGIGTSPVATADLHIYDATSANLLLETAGTGTASIEFQRGTINDVNVDFKIINNSGRFSILSQDEVNLYTATTSEIIRYTRALMTNFKDLYNVGNVGIGIAPPAPASATAQLNIYNSSSSVLRLETTTTGTTSVEFQRGAINDASIDYRIINEGDLFKIQSQNATNLYTSATMELIRISPTQNIIYKNTTFNGTLTIATGQSLTLSGTTTTSAGGLITANGGITIPTGQTLTLAGTANISANTMTTSGLITANGGITLGTSSLLTANNGITIATGKTLTLSGTANISAGGLITANGGITIATGQILTLSGTTTTSAGGLITANGGITIATGQTLTLSGTAGITSGGLITANAGITIATGQTLTLSGTANISANTMTASGLITANGGITTSATGLITANNGIIIPSGKYLSVGATTTSDVDDNTAFAIPLAPLYVKGGATTGGTCDVVIRGGVAGQNGGKAKLWLLGDASHSSYIQSEHISSGNTYLTFGTANGNALPDEKMRIGNNGNVSIGTTEINTYKLQVMGNSFFNGVMNFNTQYYGGGTDFACNKINLWGTGGNYGFGISGGTLDYFTSTYHRFLYGGGGSGLGNVGMTLSNDYLAVSGGGSYGSDLFVSSSRFVLRGASPTMYFRDTNERSGMIHMNGNNMYFLNGSGVDSETWAQQNYQDWALRINMNDNNAFFGGQITAYFIAVSQTDTDHLVVQSNYGYLGQGSSLTIKVGLYSFTAFHRCYTDDILYNNDTPENIDLFKNNYMGRVVIATGKIKTDFTRQVEAEGEAEIDGLTGLPRDKEKIDEWYSGIDKDGISIEDAIPVVALSRKKKDKRVFGVLGAPKRTTNNPNRLIINSVGEGAICVANTNGNIENGDYIQSSDLLGYGEKQDDDITHNYTIGKATIDCNFELNSPYYQSHEIENGVIVAFIACSYCCG